MNLNQRRSPTKTHEHKRLGTVTGSSAATRPPGGVATRAAGAALGQSCGCGELRLRFQENSEFPQLCTLLKAHQSIVLTELQCRYLLSNTVSGAANCDECPTGAAAAQINSEGRLEVRSLGLGPLRPPPHVTMFHNINTPANIRCGAG